MPKRRNTESHVVTLRPKLELWQELAIMADSEYRSMTSMALAIIHKEFLARFPKGLAEYFRQHPDKLIELTGSDNNVTE